MTQGNHCIHRIDDHVPLKPIFKPNQIAYVLQLLWQLREIFIKVKLTKRASTFKLLLILVNNALAKCSNSLLWTSVSVHTYKHVSFLRNTHLLHCFLVIPVLCDIYLVNEMSTHLFFLYNPLNLDTNVPYLSHY